MQQFVAEVYKPQAPGRPGNYIFKVTPNICVFLQ